MHRRAVDRLHVHVAVAHGGLGVAPREAHAELGRVEADERPAAELELGRGVLGCVLGGSWGRGGVPPSPFGFAAGFEAAARARASGFARGIKMMNLRLMTTNFTGCVPCALTYSELAPEK